MDNDALKKLEEERVLQASKALKELEEQKKEVEDQKNKMLQEAGDLANVDLISEGTILSDDELQALGDTINGSDVVEENVLEEAQREVEKLRLEAESKVKNVTSLTIDDVKKDLEASYKKQIETFEIQAKEREEAYKKELEDIKIAQMSSKEKEDYRKLQMAKDEAEKMSRMAGLVEQLKQERSEQENRILEMQKKAKDISFIRNQLKQQPWMADVVQSLKIDTEDGFKKAAVLSEQIKKWKDLEKKDLENGNRNVFNRISGGQISDNVKKKTDDIKAQMDSLLKSVIIK